MFRTLIHTTTQSEAIPIIKFFNLEESSNKNIYLNHKIILVITKQNEKEINKSLEYVFQNYSINKAIDISCCSCSDSKIKEGTIFCTNRFIFGFNFASITTIKEDLLSDENLETLLVDKQSKYFKDFFNNKVKDLYIFKIVSDYFDDIDEKKKSMLIENCIQEWKNIV